MKKLKFVPALILALTFIICISVAYARTTIYYKDISSVSIKFNFTDVYKDMLGDEGVPSISYGENSTDNVYTINAKYYIESADWYDTNSERDFVIGGTPKIVIYLATKDYPYQDNNDKEYYYRFVSGYSQTTCAISGGTFISAQRLSISSLKVIASINGIKGTYEQPGDVHWTDEWGNLQWNAPNHGGDSGYYDVALYMNDKKVTEVTTYYGTSYNFRPYMTKEGDYEARVRTVPGTDVQRTYGKKSEYAYSGTCYVTKENIYNGANEPSKSNGSGWIQTNGQWYYKNPNGEMLRSQWVQTNDKWYYLGDDGAMKTGWFTSSNNRTYYLQSNGAMVKGWMQDGDNYHFFNNSDGGSAGTMYKNKWLEYQGKWYYFDGSGNMVTGWQKIADKNGIEQTYYFYPKGSVDGLYGYMAVNTTINGFKVNEKGQWVK